MHAFERYSNNKDKNFSKKKFLSKYLPWCAQIFITVEQLINSIDEKDGNFLTNAEINRFGVILDKMYANGPETEIEGMMLAVTQLTQLQVRIWNRLNNANNKFHSFK